MAGKKEEARALEHTIPFDPKSAAFIKKYVGLDALLSHDLSFSLPYPFGVMLPACAYLDRQYMLGPSILVAPVFSETGEVEYYLPAGDWTHLLDKTADGKARTETGGKWIKEKVGYKTVPVWRHTPC